jgi:hypothetical protein
LFDPAFSSAKITINIIDPAEHPILLSDKVTQGKEAAE